MSIESEVNSTIENIKADYEGLENLGADLTNVNKNIQNIRTCLDNIYSSLPKTTGEGSNLSLSPTLKGKLNIEAYKGDTQQDTTNGYQLLDLTLAKLKTFNTSGTWNNNVYTISGVTITINDDMSIKVNGTTTVQVGLFLAGGAIPYPTGTYYLSGAINGSNDTYDVRIFNYNGTSAVAQCFTGTKQVAIVNNSQSFNMALIVRSGVTCNNVMFYPMLSTTNTSDYEPFTNGASPNPTYPQDINVVTGTQEVVVQNKNKLPSGESGTYTSNGATHTSNGKGVYTINGTATGQSFHNFQVAPYTIKSGDYLHLGNSVANGNVAIALLVSGSEQIMFRSCSTANVIQDLSSYAGKVVNYVRTFTNAQTLSNFELKPMICNFSTQTDFVEHQEQTKTLHLASNNLATTPTYINYNINNDGIGATNGYAVSQKMYVGNNTKFYYGLLSSLSNVHDSALRIGFFKSDDTFISRSFVGNLGTTINEVNIPANTSYIMVGASNDPTNGLFVEIDKVYWGFSSNANDYGAYYRHELSKIGTYQDRIFETSGKQMFNVTATSQTKNNITFTIDNGVVKANGTANSSTGLILGQVQLEVGKTYYLSGCPSGGGSGKYTLSINAENDITRLAEDIGNGTSYTPSISGTYDIKLNYWYNYNISNLTFYPMVSTDNSSFEPYGTDKWYIEKNIGKYNVTGNETWRYSVGNVVFYVDMLQNLAVVGTDILCNYFTPVANTTQYADMLNGQCKAENNSLKRFACKNTAYSDVTSFQNWLKSINMNIYYQMATPTYEEITNQTLLNELNELEKMMSYNGTTNISISGNLPMLLSVSALKGE